MNVRKCKCGCGKSITHKHPNARFLNRKHKDTFWNTTNPRGMFAHLNPNRAEYDPEYDRHPFDLED
jgi:hypothetical protein